MADRYRLCGADGIIYDGYDAVALRVHAHDPGLPRRCSCGCGAGLDDQPHRLGAHRPRRSQRPDGAEHLPRPHGGFPGPDPIEQAAGREWPE